MPHLQAKVHRMFELVEPIATVTFSEVPNEAFLALGMRNYWDGYFASRAAPLGLAPVEVVHAVFYNFADGEVARHIPWVWGKTTPEEAIAVRERGSATALRQMIGDLADSPGLVRVADLATLWGSNTRSARDLRPWDAVRTVMLRWYSWVRPPRTCRRRIRCSAGFAGAGGWWRLDPVRSGQGHGAAGRRCSAAGTRSARGAGGAR
jgi:hypothetical protein